MWHYSLLSHLKFQDCDPQVQECSLRIFIPDTPVAACGVQQSIIEVLFISVICTVEPDSVRTQCLSSPRSAASSSADETLITAYKGCRNSASITSLYICTGDGQKTVYYCNFQKCSASRFKMKNKQYQCMQVS